MSAPLVALASAVACAVLALVQAGAPAGTKPFAPAERFAVGALREDGVVVPFAELSGTTWSPTPIEDGGTLIAVLADAEKPWFGASPAGLSRWYAWSPGVRRRAVRAGEVVRVRSLCQEVWGLATDAPKREAKHTTPDVVALALTADVEVGAFVGVRAGRERSALSRFVAPHFDRVEAEYFDAQRRESPDPVAAEKYLPDPKRVHRPFALRKIVRSERPVDGATLYYVEAWRTYSPRKGSYGDFVSYFSGWVRRSADGIALLDAKFGLADEDYKGAPRFRPLGTFSHGGRRYAAVVEDGYEGLGFDVLAVEPGAMRPVHRAYAGSC